MTLARAIEIAVKVHEGQLDKQGQPYIGHPLRVMAACAPDEYAMAVAVLHDALEDGGEIARALIDGSQPGWVRFPLDKLTRRKSETYAAYIRRIINSEDETAIRVKIADLTDNLDERRGPIPASLRQRYQAAIVTLRPCLPDALSGVSATHRTTEGK